MINTQMTRQLDKHKVTQRL